MSLNVSNTNIEIKHVILPFDFSNSAKNALQHAIAIAAKFKADLIILSVMDTYSSKCLQYTGSNFVEFKELAEAKLKEYAQQSFSSNNTECLVSDARWSRAVGEISKQKDGLIIVLGVGEKDRDGFFDGSHAYRVVDHHNIPLLVVKDNQQISEYKIIVTPLDETSDTRQKLPYVKLMGGAFGAKVSLIGLQHSTHKDSVSHMESIMRQAAQYIQLKVRYYEDKLIASKHEIEDLVNYTEEEKADLLVIMSSHTKALSQMFSAPYAQQVSDKSNVPVLICPLTVSKIAAGVGV